MSWSGFRRRGAAVEARFSDVEVRILTALLHQLVALLDEGAPDSAGVQGDDPLAELEAAVGGPPPAAPEDPVLARLLPDGYRDDAEQAQEFRRFTEADLRAGKQAAARTMLDGLPAGGGRVRLAPETAEQWMTALNDVRLALGTRLDVDEDTEAALDELDRADPRYDELLVYSWLGELQELLVRSLW